MNPLVPLHVAIETNVEVFLGYTHTVARHAHITAANGVMVSAASLIWTNIHGIFTGADVG